MQICCIVFVVWFWLLQKTVPRPPQVAELLFLAFSALFLRPSRAWCSPEVWAVRVWTARSEVSKSMTTLFRSILGGLLGSRIERRMVRRLMNLIDFHCIEFVIICILYMSYMSIRLCLPRTRPELKAVMNRNITHTDWRFFSSLICWSGCQYTRSGLDWQVPADLLVDACRCYWSGRVICVRLWAPHIPPTCENSRGLHERFSGGFCVCHGFQVVALAFHSLFSDL